MGAMLLTAEPFFVALFRSLKLGLKITALRSSPAPHGESGAEARAAADSGPLLPPQARPPPFTRGTAPARARAWADGGGAGWRHHA